ARSDRQGSTHLDGAIDRAAVRRSHSRATNSRARYDRASCNCPCISGVRKTMAAPGSCGIEITASGRRVRRCECDLSHQQQQTQQHSLHTYSIATFGGSTSKGLGFGLCQVRRILVKPGGQGASNGTDRKGEPCESLVGSQLEQLVSGARVIQARV